MKRLIRKIFIFLLPIVILGIILEISLRQIPNNYLKKKEFLDSRAGEIETLILGNSHTLFGLDPAYFSGKCFNASHVAQYWEYDLAILEKYKDKFKNLKTVILPLSYASFFAKFKDGLESWRVKNYVIYYGIKNTEHSLADYSEVLSNNLSTSMQRLESFYVKGRPEISCTDLGWGTSYSTRPATVSLEKTGIRNARLHTISSFKYFDENVATLRSIISIFNKRGVKVILFMPPAYQSYRLHLNKKQLNLTTSTAQKIVGEFNNCWYFNLLNDPAFTADDYYDADHLNEQGAKKLSVFFNKLVNQINGNTPNWHLPSQTLQASLSLGQQ